MVDAQLPWRYPGQVRRLPCPARSGGRGEVDSGGVQQIRWQGRDRNSWSGVGGSAAAAVPHRVALTTATDRRWRRADGAG